MSERKVQKSDHQLSFLIELATQLNFFVWRETKDSGGIGGRLIRTGLRMKQGSYVFSVWIFRMRKRAQRMSIFKRNSINSNVQQNLPVVRKCAISLSDRGGREGGKTYLKCVTFRKKLRTYEMLPKVHRKSKQCTSSPFVDIEGVR